MIPYGKQDINEDDILAVVNVLKSDFITQGPQVELFEQAFVNYCQSSYAVAMNSATSALHVACLSLGVSKGDIVWTSPISFVASANCALYCDAKIDFVDININTGNISISNLTEKLVEARENNNLPKVIIMVHLAGQSCDMQAVKILADEYGFNIIEDASHAVGAKYKNAPIGNCQFSDITIFSFHPVKIITSAEGGLALTNKNCLSDKMRALRSHGITSDTEKMTEPSHGPWYYQQQALGFNYRMTEMQAALGLSQIKRLDTFVIKRNKLAKIYDDAFSNTTLTPLYQDKECYNAYHLYIVLMPELNNGTNKFLHKEIVSKLRNADIFAHVHYIPIHLQPYYQDLGFNKGDFPIAENYYHRAISLPLFPNLSKEDQQYIIKMIISFL
jgi:UDP-4-amino-4,6-dideoxy-N-acetyl-beta-L-altrosamine transaminase